MVSADQRATGLIAPAGAVAQEAAQKHSAFATAGNPVNPPGQFDQGKTFVGRDRCTSSQLHNSRGLDEYQHPGRDVTNLQLAPDGQRRRLPQPRCCWWSSMPRISCTWLPLRRTDPPSWLPCANGFTSPKKVFSCRKRNCCCAASWTTVPDGASLKQQEGHSSSVGCPDREPCWLLQSRQQGAGGEAAERRPCCCKPWEHAITSIFWILRIEREHLQRA